MESGISVREAAARLGVTPRAVRLQIANGRLTAEKLGRDWLVDERSLVGSSWTSETRAGRRLTPEMAWAVILLASDEVARADSLLEDPRYRARARRWLATHALDVDADRLSDRAVLEIYEAHPSELPRLRADPEVVLTGESAAETAGLVGGGTDRVELYAPAHRRAAIEQEHALIPGRGAVSIRWVADKLWPTISLPDGLAPRAAVLIDLLSSNDPRARREASRLLRS